MSINSKLKREGVEITQQLDTLKVNTIAVNIINKLIQAFPEHNFDSSILFELIARLTMYTAKMPADLSGAKYVFKSGCIYFNDELSLDEMSNVAVHECIHCIQHAYSKDSILSSIGLSDKVTNTGLALNEAVVQLMASEANKCKAQEETYYGISIKTISPNYYPLECTLATELAYFVGTFPLYHSTIYGDDIFKNTFILKTSKQTYSTLVKNFDKLLSLESNLNFFVSELQYADKPSTIKALNNLINKHRNDIVNTFFKTQNLIIEKCFKNEFNSIRNLQDITNFNKKIYRFKNIMGYCDGYEFYNEFYRKMMNLVQKKKFYIEQYGEINLYEEINQSLTIVDTSKNFLSFVTDFITKVKKLIKLNKNTEDEINN